jgi:hypothetical protein
VRLGEHQDLDVVLDPVLLAPQEAHVEELVHRLQDVPGLELVELAAHQRQIAEHPDHRLLRIGEVVDQAGEVVLEEIGALGRQIADHLDVVGAVAPGQAEISLGAISAERQALQAFRDREILLGRERLRVEALDLDLAPGQHPILLEQLLDPAGVAAEIRPELVELVGVVEAQIDRLLDACEHLPGAIRQGEQAILGQVEAGRLEEHPGEDIDREEQDHRERDADRAETLAVEGVQSVEHRAHLSCLS